jgi:hypothetical protein
MSSVLTKVIPLFFISLAACYSTYEEGATAGPEKLRAPEAETPPQRQPKAPRKKGKKKKKPEQSYKQAWKILCHAERLSGADPTASPMARASTVADWLVKNLRNKQVRYWYLSLDQVEKPDRAAAFRAEARRAGFPSCPIEALLYGAPARTDGGVG